MLKLLSSLRNAIVGWLDGFDRLAFVGQILPLMMPDAANDFFDARKIMRREATPWMQERTKHLVSAVERQCEQATGRGITHLRSTRESKEDLARQQQHESNITEGIIGAWSCVEPCRSIRMIGGKGKPTLIPIETQCKHI